MQPSFSSILSTKPLPQNLTDANKDNLSLLESKKQENASNEYGLQAKIVTKGGFLDRAGLMSSSNRNG